MTTSIENRPRLPANSRPVTVHDLYGPGTCADAYIDRGWEIPEDGIPPKPVSWKYPLLVPGGPAVPEVDGTPLKPIDMATAETGRRVLGAMAGGDGSLFICAIDG